MKTIHIAIASTMSKPGDVGGNLQQIIAFARRSAEDGADVLLTPELSACGYGSYDDVLATAEQAGDGPIYRVLAAAAKETGVVLLAGFVEAAHTKLHLAHYVVRPDGNFTVQRKNRVTRNEQPLDAAVPLTYANETDEIGQPVTEPALHYFDINGVRCVITICADGGLQNLSGTLAYNGVEVQFNPAGAGGFRPDRVTTNELYTQAGRETYLKWLGLTFCPPLEAIHDCIRHARVLAAVNMCGHDDRRLFHMGHGMIVTPMGEVPGFFHGLPNLDRQRALYAHANVNVEERLASPQESLRTINKGRRNPDLPPL